jgi:hypothetical protein
MLLPWLLLQAGAVVPPIHFDLREAKPAERPCASGAGREIVVCARNADSHRVAVLPPVEDPLPKAETRLFGQVRGGVAAEQTMVGGFPSNRIMLTVKAPF